MNPKYELTDETKCIEDGRTLHRIRALRDFGSVKAGDLGGWIENEDNLSHDGCCWVTGNGRVADNGCVTGNGRVAGNGKIAKKNDIMILENIGSRGGFTTFFRCSDNSIKVNCGCFCGTISEFAEAVKNTHGNNKFAREYALAIELARVHMGGR